MYKPSYFARHFLLLAPAVLSAFAAIAFASSARAHDIDIVVNIHRVVAARRSDALSPADFFARVTIDGTQYKTERVRQTNDARPNWSVRHTVGHGTYDVSIEVWDKDLIEDDRVDINPRQDRSKRRLDFTVSTKRKCRIGGLIAVYTCRSPNRIRRVGNENKSAAIVFSVDVER